MHRAALVTLLLLAPGCSAVKLAYNQADWYLVRKIGGMTCPTAAQREGLRGLVDAVLRWHRRYELPRYARDLRDLAGRLDRPVRRADFDHARALVKATWQRTTRGLEGAFSGFLVRLGDKQIGCLGRELAEQRRERDEALGLSPGDYRAQRTEKIADRLEDWIGDLSAAQRGRLARSIAPLKEARSLAAAERAATRRFLAILRENDPRRERARLAAVLTERYVLFSAAERPLLEKRADRRERRLWELARTLTAEQRRHLKDRLLDLAEDFAELSRQGG